MGNYRSNPQNQMLPRPDPGPLTDPYGGYGEGHAAPGGAVASGGSPLGGPLGPILNSGAGGVSGGAGTGMIGSALAARPGGFTGIGGGVSALPSAPIVGGGNAGGGFNSTPALNNGPLTPLGGQVIDRSRAGLGDQVIDRFAAGKNFPIPTPGPDTVPKPTPGPDNGPGPTKFRPGLNKRPVRGSYGSLA